MRFLFLHKAVPLPLRCCDRRVQRGGMRVCCGVCVCIWQFVNTMPCSHSCILYLLCSSDLWMLSVDDNDLFCLILECIAIWFVFDAEREINILCAFFLLWFHTTCSSWFQRSFWSAGRRTEGWTMARGYREKSRTRWQSDGKSPV